MISKKSFAALTLLFLAVAPSLHAAKCSSASLNGTYAYSSQGFTEVTPDVSPAGFVPWAQTGLTVFDGRGGIPRGTFTAATTTAAGGVNHGTFAGTYTVNRNCTGTAVVKTDGGDTFHFDLVVLGPASLTFINTDSASLLSVYSFQKIVREKGGD